MGFWGSCGGAGNVLGAYLTSALLSYGFSWQASFQLIGLINLVQILINLWLLKEPSELNIEIESQKLTQLNDSLVIPAAQSTYLPIPFMEALRTPGVLQISASYFCLKFCYYGIVMWLPLYLSGIEMTMTNYDISLAVVYFEAGTMIGGFTIGIVTDLMGCRRYPAYVTAIIAGAYFTHDFQSGALLYRLGIVGFTVGGTA